MMVDIILMKLTKQITMEIYSRWLFLPLWFTTLYNHSVSETYVGLTISLHVLPKVAAAALPKSPLLCVCDYLTGMAGFI